MSILAWLSGKAVVTGTVYTAGPNGHGSVTMVALVPSERVEQRLFQGWDSMTAALPAPTTLRLPKREDV